MQERFIVGRDRLADIPVADESVSQRHAEVTLLPGGRLLIVDCQSLNGTFLIRDGEARRIEQETLVSTDEVRLGTAVLSVADLYHSVMQRACASIDLPPPAEDESTAREQRYDLQEG